MRRLFLYALTALAAGEIHAAPLTLEQALSLAESANPTLRAAEARIDAARGRLYDTRGLFWNNPQLTGERTRREVPIRNAPTDSRREWLAGVSQTLEIAGQRGYRRDASAAALDATVAEINEARLTARADVARRFVRVLAAQRRVAIEEDASAQFARAAAATDQRRRAGEDTRLDSNLASVEAERAQNQLAQAREQLDAARAELASFLQFPLGQDIEAVGALEAPARRYALDELLLTSARRPLLRALDAREQSAASRLSLERAAAYPDVTVGLNVAREGPGMVREKLTTLWVSVPLPLFRRNATGIGEASTQLSQARIDRASAVRDVGANVRTLWQREQSLGARVARLRESVLPALEQNRRLGTKAYRLGELGLLQLLIVNRQWLDAQRDLLDASTDLRLTRIELEQAAGIFDAQSR